MDVLEAVESRRSARSFEQRPLSPEIITAIESTILYSPSGSNSQEAHLVIVQDPEQLRRIKRFAQGMSGDPAAVVVLCSNKSEALVRGGTDTVEVLRFVNVGISAAYILLTAHSLGVGSCPIRGFHPGALRQILELPDDVEPELLIGLGYTNQPPRLKTSKGAVEVISHDRYGNRP